MAEVVIRVQVEEAPRVRQGMSFEHFRSALMGHQWTEAEATELRQIIQWGVRK